MLANLNLYDFLRCITKRANRQDIYIKPTLQKETTTRTYILQMEIETYLWFDMFRFPCPKMLNYLFIIVVKQNTKHLSILIGLVKFSSLRFHCLFFLPWTCLVLLFIQFFYFHIHFYRKISFWHLVRKKKGNDTVFIHDQLERKSLKIYIVRTLYRTEWLIRSEPVISLTSNLNKLKSRFIF